MDIANSCIFDIIKVHYLISKYYLTLLLIPTSLILGEYVKLCSSYYLSCSLIYLSLACLPSFYLCAHSYILLTLSICCSWFAVTFGFGGLLDRPCLLDRNSYFDFLRRLCLVSAISLKVFWRRAACCEGECMFCGSEKGGSIERVRNMPSWLTRLPILFSLC